MVMTFLIVINNVFKSQESFIVDILTMDDSAGIGRNTTNSNIGYNQYKL